MKLLLFSGLQTNMKSQWAQLLAFLLLVTPAPGRVTAAAPDTDVEEGITRLREGLVDSLDHDDVDRLLTFLDADAVVTWQDGKVCEGREAVKAYYERTMKGDHPVVSKVTVDPEVLGSHVQGDWAVSWGNLNDRFELTDGRELPLNSRFTATLVRRGDHWRVAAFHVSVNAFDNPILRLAMKKVSLVAGVSGMLAGVLIGVVLAHVLRRIRKSGGP